MPQSSIYYIQYYYSLLIKIAHVVVRRALSYAKDCCTNKKNNYEGFVKNCYIDKNLIMSNQ